ncbi:phage portal protein, PBSX family [Burkholderia thailandensis E264]|nr:phage portal protein, PBSX family [Burkholderia thailandensis 2002721723]AIP23956.1 phage portal protein, PBSX family [Burkholderia thailandensis E264]AIS94368.1 phage portal protein, PBSX family [Burkholderia thailandensis MSMB59]AJY00321.1 phage portal protein, PBSX family [Burkholderia thailandensis 2002721643]AOJ43803.1 terminase [Burkholderia thailandensis]
MVSGTLRLEPALAKYVRRKADFSGFVYVNGWQDRHAFEPGSVFQLVRSDGHQSGGVRPARVQARCAELNDWRGEEVVVFDDYEIPPTPVAA